MRTSIAAIHRPTTLYRVLVADPDEDARALYRHSFDAEGCDLVEAADGRDALEKALVREPSLILTELRLALIDGFSLCEILRQDRMTADVPIVVVTAETRATELDRAYRAGADVVVAKPTSTEMLLAEMRRLLLRSRELRGRAAAARTKWSEQLERSVRLLKNSARLNRVIMARAHERFTTTTPPIPPLALRCPSCNRPLKYERSHIGGVSDRDSEQWDYFSCSPCGSAFRFRQRTNTLHRLSDDDVRWIKRS